MCMSAGIDVDLGISAMTDPSAFNCVAVPSPSPATRAFPLLLQDTQLTPDLITGPVGPCMSAFDFRSAIRSSPFVVTAAKR